MPPSKATKKKVKRSYQPDTAAAPLGVAADAYAPTAWGGSTDGLYEDVVCPSGQLCLARRPGVQELVKAGLINQVDSLSALVEEKHIKRVNGEPTLDAASLMTDEQALRNVADVVDRVVIACVIRPTLVPVPADPTAREDGLVYIDYVDWEDKMFIFNYAVGGTRDYHRFRRELEESLGDVQPQQEDGVPTE